MIATETRNAIQPRVQVLLPSGRIIDLAAPERDSWTDEDLAIGLARTYRWGGHSLWARPLSVAQHSLTVLAVRTREAEINPSLAAFELLHDAEEGLIGFDCIAPLKAVLGEPFAKLTNALTAAIGARYGLPRLTGDEFQQHKTADRVAAATEALHVVGWSRTQISDDLGIIEAPLSEDPLADQGAAGGYRSWEPWASDYAAERWLEKFESITEASKAIATSVLP